MSTSGQVKAMPEFRLEVKGNRVFFLLLVVALLVPGIVTAQVAERSSVSPLSAQGWDAGRMQVTRAELQELLVKYEQAGNASGYSAAFKARAASEAALIRSRLESGDFQVGDQINLLIEGEFRDSTLTLTVGPGRSVLVPGMGELSLTGVLRSELKEKVQEFAARYIRSPVVHTRTMIRLAVIGQVQRPGFHAIPAEALLSDAIMVAGGPTGTAKLSEARVERNGERIWDGRVFQSAIAEGRTLDQMSIQSGDQLILPLDGGGGSATLLRVLTIVPATLVAILGLIRAF